MLILAPMQGLTELMFRRAYNQCFPGALDSIPVYPMSEQQNPVFP